jgi:hypothetical protein
MKRDASLKIPNVYLPDEHSSLDLYQPNTAIALRCPHCLKNGSFTSPLSHGVSYSKREREGTSGWSMRYSVRLCPNPECSGLVTVVQKGMSVVATDPPELIEFDASNLPPKLLETLSEAISCHAAGAYRASAMMVRRMLEEICELDGATGSSLHQRLAALKSKIVLPNDLFDAMGELKALGNDAAHVEAKSYDGIGAEESADSIELAKEILKARYQLKGLIARLQARKKP